MHVFSMVSFLHTRRKKETFDCKCIHDNEEEGECLYKVLHRHFLSSTSFSRVIKEKIFFLAFGDWLRLLRHDQFLRRLVLKTKP